MDMKEMMQHSPSMSHISPKVRQIIQQFARETKQLLQDNVIEEYLFGSYATNTQTPLSDIDILIIVKHSASQLQRQISGLASEYSLEHDLYISPILQDMGVWQKNQACQTLFYQDVMQDGIPL
jgi:predicted nucleotidyltransferase